MNPTIAALSLDVVLVGAGVLSAAAAWKGLRGEAGTGIAIAGIGLVILGFAHISETLMWLALNMGADSIELIHRVLVILGFGFLVIGVTRTGRELRREWQGIVHSNATLLEAEEDLRLANEELRERNHQLLTAVALSQRQPIRVLLAEQNAALRRVLASILADEPCVEVVGETSSSEDLPTLAGSVSPHVAIVDESMASPELIGALKSAGLGVLVIGSYSASAFDALAAGASDYILKDAGRERLLRAIEFASRGRSGAEAESEIWR